MKHVLSLVLAGGLLVPLFSTPALCAKSSVNEPHKKGAHHKRHAHHAANATKASTSAPKSVTEPTSPQ